MYNVSASTDYPFMVLNEGVDLYNPTNTFYLSSATHVLSTPSFITFITYAGPIRLSANTTYWVGPYGEIPWPIKQTAASWNYTDSNIGSGAGFSTTWADYGPSSWTTHSGSPYVMQVNATPIADAVPEPSTYILLGIALGAVGFARKKMNKHE